MSSAFRARRKVSGQGPAHAQGDDSRRGCGGQSACRNGVATGGRCTISTVGRVGFGGKRMEITFRLTREDYQRFCGLVSARVGTCRWRLSPPVLFAVSFAALVAFGLLHRTFGESGVVAAALGYVAGLLSMMILFWALHRQSLQHSLGDDSPMLAESHLRLDRDGIEATAAHGTTRYAWHGIKEITETGDLVVVWIDRALGIVVPKRAFAGDQACRSFVETVRAHLPQSVTAGPRLG
jgi:YcxB-like protein